VPSVAGTNSTSILPPDLAAVTAAWPSLPAAIKAGILALVHAAKRGTNA